MNYIRHKLVNYLTKHLLKAITVNDILRVEENKVYIGKRKLSREDIASLQDQAEVLQRSMLWELIENDIRWTASDLMLEKALNERDIVFGKAMIYNFSLMQTFLTRLKLLK